MKQRGFALSLELAIVFIIVIVFIASSISIAGISWLKNHQSDMLKSQCNQLEFALRCYGQNHLIVDISSERFDSEGNFHYNKLQTYPASQTKLKDLHELGYLHTALKIEDFQKGGTAVFYTTNSDHTKYKIEVTLPNGEKYKTPGSSSF